METISLTRESRDLESAREWVLPVEVLAGHEKGKFFFSLHGLERSYVRVTCH